jgi:hypothetical protein
MNCFVCDEPSSYPICCDCTREGYDLDKILDGSQKPKFNEKDYDFFIFKEVCTYQVKAKDEAHARRKIDAGKDLVDVKLTVQKQIVLDAGQG